jgi:hypothetical protein
MELKKLKVIGACVFAAALLYGVMFMLVWFRMTYVRPDPEQTVDYWKDRVEAFRAETDAAIKRAHAAEVDELKARLAVASCDKSRANLEEALKRERSGK